MTKEDVIKLASDYVASNRLEADEFVAADFVTFPTRDEASIPPEIWDTYSSVKSRWRDYWAVRFRRIVPPGVVECPETELICVYETGEVVHKLSM
jgi:hypothetical protein